MPEPYYSKRKKPWGYEIIYTPPELGRVGKVIHVMAGKKLSLQYHTEKEETMSLLQGEAILWLKRGTESMRKIRMRIGYGYTVYPGEVHRLEAREDSVFLEVSSPEKGTTVRLEDDYRRPDEVF